MRDFKEIRVAVAGTGYVGLSIATLLSQHHHVTAVDVIPEKVEKLNNKVSPIQDDYIEKYLAEKPLDLVATLDGRLAYADADFVVIAAPTNYDPVKNYFDTSRVEEVIDLVLEVSERQVNRHKKKLIDKEQNAAYLQNSFVEEETDEDDEIKIVRCKKFAVKPMYPEDACIQMDLLGHNFFVFRNAETDKVNVVYKRRGNTFGLIEPEF